MTWNLSTGGVGGVRIIVKGDDPLSGGYSGGISGSSGAFNFVIWRGVGGITQIASQTWPITLSGSITLRLTYNAGNLYLYCNGVLRCWAFDTTFDANTRVAFYRFSAANPITFFACDEATTTAFRISPASCSSGTAPFMVELFGTGTAWSPGSPGSPTFTASIGTVGNQSVLTSTYATLYYTPPNAAGTAIFTDPSSALTATMTVVQSPGPGTGGGFSPKLTDLGAAIINRAGTTPPSEGVRVWTNQDIVTEAPILMNQNDALRYIVQYIWFIAGGPPPEGAVNYSALLMDWVGGGYVRQPFIDTAPSNTSLKQDLAAALSSMGDLAAQLTGAVDLLGGDFPILSHRDLKIAIDGIQGGADLQPVLEALAAIRGDTTTSLYTLLQSLAGIRTIHSYSLQDVLDAIHLLPTSFDGGYTTADRLANAAGFVGVLAAIAALAAVEAEDAASSSGALAGILALATELAGGVASILAALESLKALLGGGPNEYRPPVWPGEAHVDWGAAIAIESNEPLIGEMHGVVVDITGCEGGTRSFGYDGIKCYSHVGALGFCSDRGDMEPFQALGPTKGIYTVKTMASAFACRLFRGRNVRGTIQPWKIKAD